jgi:UDP-glucose 4-epimerase
LDACEAGKHHVLNIGATPAGILDVIAMTREVTGRDIPVTFHPPHSGEIRELRVDASRARDLLSWRPESSGLARLITDQWRAEQSRI